MGTTCCVSLGVYKERQPERDPVPDGTGREPDHLPDGGEGEPALRLAGLPGWTTWLD